MIDTIREAIASINSNDAIKIADWRLVERVISRQERYYVANRAEQARMVDDRGYALTVYVDSAQSGTKFRGEATISLQPSFSAADGLLKIRQAVVAASKSRNPWFALPEPSAPKVKLPISGFESLTPADQVEIARDAFFSAAARFEGSARINALELFITRERRRLLNSRGIDYSTVVWRGYSEFVVEADSPSGTVELFDDIEFSEPDPARLASSIASRLAQVHDRALAAPMPQLRDLPVILRGKEAEEAFAWFYGNSRTEAVYSKASAFEVGKSVQGAAHSDVDAEPVPQGATDSTCATSTSDTSAAAAALSAPVAEPLDLWAEPAIEGLPASTAFDPDGFPLERTEVISGGVLKTLTGSVRHADWLGFPRRGAFPLFSVSPGSTRLEKLHAAPYLEPVMFSDFQLDPVTGDFGAEIRLAYYFDGKHTVPVSGGSISGSLSALSGSMRRSVETEVASRSRSPVALMLNGVTITGNA